jgi:hypothetical protein
VPNKIPTCGNSALAAKKSFQIILGQLFSVGNFGVFKSLKKTVFVRISALASKMGHSNKIKALYYIYTINDH